MNLLPAFLATDPVEKRAFFEGFRVASPTMIGIGAWGMVTGIAMINSGLTIVQALAMTFIVFAGSAQLAALPLIAANVPVLVVFLTGVVVNLRFVIFAAAMAPHFLHLPWHKRLVMGYFNADTMMALFPRRYPPETVGQIPGKLGYYSGVVATNWFSWQAGSVIGILLGSQIPSTWGIDFAGTLALLAITIPLIVNSATLAGVVVAVIIAVAGVGLPYRLGLLGALIGGMAAAMAFERMTEKKKEQA